MPRFVRATGPKGQVHWINFDHVRHVSIEPAMGKRPQATAVHIDNWWVERRLVVVETPEQLLEQLR